ncbi:hypothetical protein HPB49_017848 [Dermacentor silvarum]|uniref:Uncharacterized protein n=1 Tax=Dermacentor silvarum TaxID=543639 RepID=A0ACB8DF11_DERSI|nr:hypothetical protein HPB49_017848 [Dermacentor silvarum]
MGPKKSYSGDQVMCNSSFCLNEADHLSAIFHRNLDPCEDFYAFACQGWLVTSSDQEKYEDVDDALSGTIEELAKGLLEASASGDDLRETLALFGLDITKVDAPSAEDVLVAASNVLLGLGIAPLFSIVLQPNPEVKGTTMLALDEADVLLGRDEASESENVNKLTSLACKFIETLSAVAGEGSNSTDACAYVAHVAVEMAKMISRVAKSKGKWRNDTMLAVKNPAQIDVVKSLLSSKAESLFHYLGLHVTVYVSPFLEDGQSFMEASYFLLSGRTRSPPKWRLCVRLVDRILPSLLIVSFEQYMNRSDTFSELMAYIMAEELRSAFIDEFSHLQRLDNWTKYIISEQIETEVPAMNQSLQYFLKLSALVASKWADPNWNFVPNARVNVPLKNSYEFASAFGCAQGTPMNPSNKCSFWD